MVKTRKQWEKEQAEKTPDYKYVVIHEMGFSVATGPNVGFVETDEELKSIIEGVYFRPGFDIIEVLEYKPVKYNVTQPVVTIER